MTEKRNPFSSDYHTPEIAGYFQELMGKEDSVLEMVLSKMREKGLREIQISALEGRILECLVRSCQARKSVEIGTLGGYSAHWIARGMPENGRLYTLEKDPLHAAVAAECVQESGLTRKISVMEGDAVETLARVSKLGPFDFCFIDADKVNYPFYLKWAAKNLRSGGVVAADNAFLKGMVNMSSEKCADSATAIRAMREFYHVLTDTDSFSSCCVIPTGEGMAVGIKA